MHKISLYELEHIEDEASFEKVRKKGKPVKEAKHPEKRNNVRKKKIDYWEYSKDED